MSYKTLKAAVDLNNPKSAKLGKGKSLYDLPNLNDILEKYPISKDIAKMILIHREEIINILDGSDERFIVITGPCSVSEGIIEYAEKLKILQEEVQDVIKIVLRFYTQKPRTTVGWEGIITDPKHLGQSNINLGIEIVRKLRLQISEENIAIADELLMTKLSKYTLDLISWGAIGARSSENPGHRSFASSLEYPIGIKNTTGGNMQTACNSIIAARTERDPVIFNRTAYKSKGNKYAHLVLRGANGKPNYQEEHVKDAISTMRNNNIDSPIIIDASHENTYDTLTGKKDHKRQINVTHDILYYLEQNKELTNHIKGIMLESFIKEGNHKITKFNDNTHVPGMSITDPCLNWNDTKDLILYTYDKILKIKR